MIKAELKNYRQSPRKVRLVASLVRGKKVDRALAELNFLNKKAAPIIKKLIDSAVANAKHNFKTEKESLIVKEIRVDEGPTLKRFRAGARGRAYGIKKRTCRVLVVLSDGVEEVEVKREKKTVKKTVAKKEAPKKTTEEKVSTPTKKKIVAKDTKVKKTTKKETKEK